MDVLYSWVGHTDLKSFLLQTTDAEIQTHIQALLGNKNDLSSEVAPGPLETVVRQRSFGQIVLLWSYKDEALAKEYARFIGDNCRENCVSLRSPIDYEEVYQAADGVLVEQEDAPRIHRYFLLSSGTPTMAAIWLLLGKTKYPADFLQAYQNKVIETNIPFDLRMDVIPKIIRENDQNLGEIPDKMLKDVSGFQAIIGDSPAIRRAVNMGRHAALHDVNVLLTGESGTGKEMFAKAIHLASHRAGKPFLAVNCAAFSDQLLGSELFGHRKGAFTGADQDKVGLFKAAAGGTLFLDEIGECSPEMQRTLLRVLQPPSDKPLTWREFTPVGGTKPEYADVRIIAATNRNLLNDINSGNYRSDLYYRLAAVSICLPPLRERGGDVRLLAEHLLDRINSELGANIYYLPKHFPEDTLRVLQAQRWEGNVRELLNAIIQGAVMAIGPSITPSDIGLSDTLPANEASSKSAELTLDLDLDTQVDDLKRRLINKALEMAEHSKMKAYKLLGMKSYQRLDSMMRNLGMDFSP